MPFDRLIPYNDLPPLPPGKEVENASILKEVIRASRALSELNGLAGLLPNQALLVQAIGLQEAKSSSEIENIVTTNDELYLALADGGSKIDSQTKEVLYYKDALWHGFNALQDEKRLLTTPLFEELAQITTNTTERVRKFSGTKLQNPLSREIIYTPPEGEKIIRDKLANLEQFIYSEKNLDPLIKMAILHYQFEAIHPFSDGNGRVGRILNILYLIHEGLLSLPILYLSRFIIENKRDYYLGLQNVTKEEAWEPWIMFMLEGITYTALRTKNTLLKILKLFEETSKLIQTQLPKIYSKDLVELIFRQPYCRIAFLESAGIARRQTASVYLKELERIGVLRGIKAGREWYFIHEALYKILISE